MAEEVEVEEVVVSKRVVMAVVTEATEEAMELDTGADTVMVVVMAISLLDTAVVMEVLGGVLLYNSQLKSQGSFNYRLDLKLNLAGPQLGIVLLG